MFKKIVMARDGSEGSRRAISIAVELGKRDATMLPEGEIVPVEFTPEKPGECEFTCQMGKLVDD